MLLFLEILAVAVVLVYIWYRTDQKRYSKYPPGPLRLPVIGSIIQIMTQSKFPATSFMKLAETYGDVMFLKMGGGEAVVFSSRESVREILNHEKAIGRTQFHIIREKHSDRNLGIIWSWGKTWQTLRRFTLKTLRDYGFGKSSTMDVVINEEIEKYIQHIKSEVGQNPKRILHVESDMFNLTFVNVLWRLVSGKSFDLTDTRMIGLLQAMDNFMRSTNIGFDITDTFPILRDLLPNWSGKAVQSLACKTLYEWGRELVDEQRQQLRNKSDAESFIDCFAAKVEESMDDPDTDFNEEQFVVTILDLIIGGGETSSKTITFGMLYMLIYKDVQEKVQNEIDMKIPKGVPLDMSMKAKLPYTTATLLEIFRYSTILPTPTAREATDDFIFRGYLIKKGTSLITNVQAVHFSKNLWGDPHVFRPERFLNADGTAVDKTMEGKLESFGSGSRFCLGKSLAEATTFLYFASMMRHFKLRNIPGGKLPSIEPLLGLTYTPRPFDIHIIERL